MGGERHQEGIGRRQSERAVIYLVQQPLAGLKSNLLFRAKWIAASQHATVNQRFQSNEAHTYKSITY